MQVSTKAGSSYDPRGRGYYPVYREGETNHCPGCGRTQWIIGRITAECAFCATAIPLQESRRGVNAQITVRSSGAFPRLHD